MTDKRNFDKVARNFLKATLLDKTDSHCAYCGKFIDSKNMHIEHVIPSSRGGSDNIDNLVAACQSCNISKGVLSLDQFRLITWFRKKFSSALNQHYTPAQIIDLNSAGFFDNIPEERNYISHNFFYHVLNRKEYQPF